MLDDTLSHVEEMTVVSAVQYRRTSEDSHASQEQSLVFGAFVNEHVPSPYGLGGDGTHEKQSQTTNDIGMSMAMGILASGEQLPRGPSINNEADEIDSIIGLTTPRVTEADSVLGSDTTI